MDFVADNLFDGRKLRMLTVVDCYTRKSLDIHVDQSLKGEDVVRVQPINALMVISKAFTPEHDMNSPIAVMDAKLKSKLNILIFYFFVDRK